MEAVVHLDRPAAMPSQSQMSYSRNAGLHGRQTQNPERDVRSYKSNQPQQHIPVSGHNPGPYSGVSSSNYNPMRYIHPTPYAAPPPGATPVPYCDIYPSSRSSNLVSERAQNLEFVREQIKPRISLLPNTDYLASLSRNRLHQNESYRDQMGGPPSQTADTPIKKIRLGEPKSDHQRSLRVDTRDDSQPAATYNPQVEAISPTLPSEALQEDANFRSTKDDLLHGIAKVDREITKTELEISKLKRKQQELEEAAKKPAIKKEEEEIPQPKHQSPAQKIYAENRRKAQDAHMLLASLGPIVHLPLYNQPSDTPTYQENRKKHLLFRPKLLDHLRRKNIEKENKEKRLTTTYSLMVQEWLKKVEKIENSQKRKGKDAKNREYFEKIFPKLRKQREDRERFNRVGARVKSEADIEEIMDGLQEQELEDKKMRSYAVVPPLLLDAQQRSIFYINNNGRLEDFAADYKEKQLLNVWTQSEKEMFKEKFLQHPKNFGMIASYLERKSVCDCVQYYYISKKTENYKRLLRKSRQRLRSRNQQSKVNSGSVNNANLDIIATASGVTTRLQREQLQKQEPLPSSVAAECDSHSSFLLDSQPPPLLLPSEVKPGKKKDDTKEEKKKKEDEETTDDEPIDPIGGDVESVSGVACAVCKTESVCSRALPRSQASQYGLKEEEVPLDARVCNLCRCKAVRSRFTNCPVPTCPNAKGHRVKRLRPLPCKWADLASAIKEPIAAEFQIDEAVTKCCSACFNRISRRIAVSLDLNSSTAEDAQMLSPSQSSLFHQWTEDEIESLKNAIKVHGSNWNEVSQSVGKPQHQCMNFFYTYQQKLGLDQLLSNEKINADERKPVLTDEEESGSSTSSCDEVGATSGVGVGGDSDTASAPSPLHSAENVEQHLADNADKIRSMSITPPIPQIVAEGRETVLHPEPLDHHQSTSSPQAKVTPASMPPTLYPAKEDYDSSATETADEGQGGGETEPTIARTASPKIEDPSSPLTVKTVKDLMLGVIEMQLMKNQGGQVQTSNTPGGPPTISSILKTDHHNLGYSRDKSNRQIDNSLATVSVVSSHHSHQQMQDMPKDSLVVQGAQPYDQSTECTEDRTHRWSASADLSGRISQRYSDLQSATCGALSMCDDSIQGDKMPKVQQSMREPREIDGVTLDLSIKKPRENHLQTSKIQQHPISSQNTVFRVAQPPEQQGFFHLQVMAMAAAPLAPKLSPGVISGGASTATSKAQCGSIIHGTPVSSPNIYSQNRYESTSSSLIHQVPTQHKESGSITQGTPVHQRSSLYPNAEYFGKRSMPSTGYFSPRQSSYNVEQRQIIMNDYITSQQMHGPGNSSGPRSSRDKIYYQSNTRQGVIQRHNTKPPSPGVSHYPPGHEAFSSLVDVAVRQPSLPVPPAISMPMEHKNIQEEKRHLHEGLGERFNRDSPHDRFSNRESERYIRDTQKVHASQQSREPPQQQQIPQQREQVSLGGRDSYQPSQHHLDREVQLQHLQREQSMHREREHHSQQSQKLRDSHMSHLELRVNRAQMSGYQQRLIHDTHHPLDQRMMQPPSFREQPSSSQATSNSSSRSHPSQEPSSEQQSNRGRSESSTLTAASLIDAIITHQINQSSEVQTTTVPSGTTATPQPQPTRPGDRLFQSFHKDCNESNGKLSPVKNQEAPKSHSITPQSMQSPIIDHVDMFNNPTAPQGMRSAIYQGYDQLRRALQQKDQNQALEKNEEHLTRFYSEAPVPLSPLDYVKNRIAEVMRTSEEDSVTNKDNESPVSNDMQDETDHPAGHSTSSSSFLTQSHNYPYPFSALSLNTSGASTVPIPSHPVTKTTESIPEPAPLLSSQYEPLSDED